MIVVSFVNAFLNQFLRDVLLIFRADRRSFLEPDDIKAVAVAVLAHRLILAPEARSTGLSGEQIVGETLDKTPVPV